MDPARKESAGGGGGYKERYDDVPLTHPLVVIVEDSKAKALEITTQGGTKTYMEIFTSLVKSVNERRKFVKLVLGFPADCDNTARDYREVSTVH